MGTAKATEVAVPSVPVTDQVMTRCAASMSQRQRAVAPPGYASSARIEASTSGDRSVASAVTISGAAPSQSPTWRAASRT